MREIKFRAFHRLHKRIFFVTNLDWVLNEISGIWLDDEKDTGRMTLDLCELMQFTGRQHLRGGTMRHIETLRNLKEYLESCDQITVTKENVLHALETVLAEYEAETKRELANRCDDCGATLASYHNGCPMCGAPVCCP